ncbi:hypothetical protein [cf. Phormidesmis sp. LEGE 11477]|uniref:hypothetical protein n=1 Tax=cf. Phormidesmis sp. LEGE 11477 TaxID=1828680 RepID=UPI00187E1B2B|nr:hypothetical protein [cf. Phormidesmis sp. LEGE 11477]MBE9064625.1 hypothetical protein [cf. Phormidesmis sp. LEGE 11477]
MSFFVDLTKSLLSPRALQGFVVGLFIGGLVVLMSSRLLRPLVADDTLLAVIGNLIGAACIAWYGTRFASKAQRRRKSAVAVFLIAGLIGLFLIRDVVEQVFNLPPDQLTNNVISYALSCGIACALAGGVYEAIAPSD